MVFITTWLNFSLILVLLDNMTKKSVLWIVLGSLAIFGVIFLIAFETTWFENTFDATGLTVRSAVIGFIAGIVLAWIFIRKITDSLDKVKATLAIVIATLIIVTLCGSLSNRLFADKNITQEKVILFKEIPYYSGRFGLPPKDQIQWTGFYIFVVRNDKIERLVSDEALFLPEMAGLEVEIPVRKGFWGYDIFVPE